MKRFDDYIREQHGLRKKSNRQGIFAGGGQPTQPTYIRNIEAPEKDEPLGDPTLFDDPYVYAGVTNSYGMLRKKNIKFNEI